MTLATLALVGAAIYLAYARYGRAGVSNSRRTLKPAAAFSIVFP